MKRKIHIDFETFSSEDIRKVGSYKYMDSLDFEVMLVGYKINNGPIIKIDLINGENLTDELIECLEDEDTEIWAHNANFERNCLIHLGYTIPVSRFFCTAVLAAYCGLPLGLEDVSRVLQLGEKAKSSIGKALIRYFCVPVKPTKANGMRQRNLPKHDPEKWNQFKNIYLHSDVDSESEVAHQLGKYAIEIPDRERFLYQVDQEINDLGVKVDISFAKKALELDTQHKKILNKKMQAITGLSNPNSPDQLKSWLTEQTGDIVDSIAKEPLNDLLEVTGEGPIRSLLELRQMAGKTSTKKYTSIVGAVCDDGRVHGLLQFYGANRTGRWAGRLVQVQNLPQNHMENLNIVRSLVLSEDYETISMLFDDVSDVLSQMIRTTFIPPDGMTFLVNDFSAIEARVIAWLASEKWRLDVFNTDGKIYEWSASKMFGVDISEVTKGSDYRKKGKIAELGLGFGGAVGALLTMGGDKMGLTELEMKDIVYRWRKESPRIVALWTAIEKAAMDAIIFRKTINLPLFRNLKFSYDGDYLMITLPSGRKLFYSQPIITNNKFGNPGIKYRGMDQTAKKWTLIETYGGKLTENIVQAIARDLLAESLIKLKKAGYRIVMHVHDEIIVEVEKSLSEAKLKEMTEIMSMPVLWAEGLPLESDGFITDFYKKD